MNKLIFTFFLLTGILFTGFSQEVRCNLTVNTQQITGGSVQLEVVESFERQVREFLNDRRWTNDVVKANEVIEFNMLINFKVASSGNFKCQMQINSVRPVFNSSYNTSVFSFKDDQFNFSFSQMDILNFNIQNSGESQLTALLAYYVYLVIGYDYETYSPGGGKKYLDIAMNIANQNQNYGGGWAPLDSDKNRYWIVQNMIQPRYKKLNQCLYMYHRKGLDQMYENATEGRKKITESLYLLEDIYEDVPDLVNIQIFFNAKGTEIVNIYKEADSSEKQKIISLLDKIYPSGTQNWSKINAR